MLHSLNQVMQFTKNGSIRYIIANTAALSTVLTKPEQ